jgi:hypothetical protein
MTPPKKINLPNNNQPARRIIRDKDMSTNYANMVRVVHSPHEFIFDFGQIIPGDLLLPIKSRIIMTPIGAKLLLNALKENLDKYEDQNGEIILPERPNLASQLFKNINLGEDDPSPEDNSQL